jgi:hypothetical protein
LRLTSRAGTEQIEVVRADEAADAAADRHAADVAGSRPSFGVARSRGQPKYAPSIASTLNEVTGPRCGGATGQHAGGTAPGAAKFLRTKPGVGRVG